MRELVTSDTHWYHDNILEYDNRPFDSMSDMLDKMIGSWNAVVDPDDIVYHLGDVALIRGGREVYIEYLSELNSYLNGRKILILGNHDRNKSDMHAAGFSEVYSELDIVRSGIRIHMQHKPWGRDPNKLIDASHADIVLHGHVHTGWFVTTNKYHKPFVNVGCMWWAYAPVALDIVLKPMLDEMGK